MIGAAGRRVFHRVRPPPPPRERQVNHMKFSCETALLGQAIADVSLAVAQKATLPALEGILLTARRGGLTLVGYNLELGITERTSVRVLISNILTKPSYWDSVIKYYFGEYSRTKHELCIEQLGQDFPETSSEFYGSLTYWQVSGQYMSNYFEENYPVRDENGKIIEPW